MNSMKGKPSSRGHSSNADTSDLIRTTPLPEEIDRGFLGRVMRLNGIEKKTEAIKTLSAWTVRVGQPYKQTSLVLLLSTVANMDTPAFVRRHTTLPLRRGITSYKAEVPHGDLSDGTMYWPSATHPTRRGAYCCEQCAKEDLEFHGYSYWRRDHQTPGLYWCPKHGTPLHFIEDDDAFLLPPSQHLDYAVRIQADWALQAKENPWNQRFLDICFYLMERPKPFTVKDASAVLSAKARETGFKVNRGVANSPLMSDHIIDCFGRPWLSTVLQAIANKPKGELSTKLDGVLFLHRSASSVSAYVLAAAVLFDSAEEAINALEETPVSKPDRLPTKRIVDTASLISAYIQTGGSYGMTAESLYIDKQTTRLRLIKEGLPHLVDRGSGDIKRALKAFFIEKRPLDESATAGGISTRTLEAMLRLTGQHMNQILQSIDAPPGPGTGIPRTPQLTPLEASRHQCRD